MGWIKVNSGMKLHAACGLARNAYGLCDMSGNVWEWTSDWYDEAYPGTTTDPVGAPSGSSRVFRGGSWSNGPAAARVAIRLGLTPDDRGIYLGVRLVRSGS